MQKVIFPLLSSTYQTTVPVADRADLEALTPNSLMFDVAIVDLLWGSVEAPPDIDGLDVIDHLEETGRVASILVAVHGQHFERDFLHEAVSRPLVRGAVFKAGGVAPVLDAVEVLARGQSWFPPTLPDRLFDRSRLTIDRWFRSRPLVAHVAGAIASHRANSWASIAEVTSYQRTTVESSPRLFGEALYRLGEVNDPDEVNQAVVFRWVGERAAYILSWCRRNGMGHYRREPITGG